MLGGLSQAYRVMTSKPTVSNRVIRCSVSVTFPERDLARDEPRRVPLSARDQRQKLVVVGVRIALRAHHLPLPRDDVVDRDGDLTALLRVRTVPAKVPPIKLYASVPQKTE